MVMSDAASFSARRAARSRLEEGGETCRSRPARALRWSNLAGVAVEAQLVLNPLLRQRLFTGRAQRHRIIACRTI
jgi:hypothetical protein